MAEENKELTQQELSEQNRIRREKLAQMQEAGKDPFQIVKYDVTHHSDEIRANFDALENKDVCIAGRLMSKRIMGKASFCNIQDRNGLMQSYVSKNDIGEEDYAAFKKYDIGDIIGIKGFVFKTKTGEISVHAKEVVLLSKSLQVLPEKFHGLKDQELRYRQRYVDLIVNPESRDTFIKRSKIITEIRRFLDAKGFLEVETPVLQTIPGGASARPFITHHNTLDIDMYCRNIHHALVICVGLIQLHQGKFGVMTNGNALVSEYTTDFIYSFKAADNQSLQGQLQRNNHNDRCRKAVYRR